MEDDWIPYSQREEFADLAPIRHQETDIPVAPIDYSDRFLETMAYFRALCRKEEASIRALSLTMDVIQVNPGAYSGW
jgi:protein farnesyltransferase/geranylgeranyltransferase type-1 subunit alpha